MRQLKGKVKESHKEKHERREDFMQQKRRVFKIVLPVLAVIWGIIIAYVYYYSRPKEKTL